MDTLDGPGAATARGDAPWPPDRVSEDPSPFEELRPVGPGGILDGAFTLLRYRFRPLIALTACLFIPVRAFDLLTVILTADSAERLQVGPSMLALGGEPGWGFLVIILQALALSVLGLCAGHLAARLASGSDAAFPELARLAATRGWVSLALVPLGLLIKVPLSCVPLGFIFGDALVFLSSVVAGAERLGPIRAWRRGMRLSSRSFGPMLAVVLGGLVITQMLQLSLYTGPVLLVGAFTMGDAALTAASQAGAVLVLVGQPLTACIAARAYLDLRCRTEGADLRRRVWARFGDPTSGDPSGTLEQVAA